MKKFGFKKCMVLGAAILMTVFGSGCALALIGLGAGAGIAGTAYVDGKLTSTVDATPEQIKPATEAAFKALNIKLVSATANSLEAEIKGKSPEENKDVTVSASLDKSGKSKVGIRVGTFGNQELSEKIFAEMTKNLPKKKK
jgi:hypothetical protein